LENVLSGETNDTFQTTPSLSSCTTLAAAAATERWNSELVMLPKKKKIKKKSVGQKDQ
jgi:hypothetical protein